MTVIKKILTNRQTELVPELDAALVTANGWTKAGSTYTSPTVDGRTLSFTFTDTAGYSQFVLPTKASANRTLYLVHGTSSQNVQCDLTIHAGTDFFYINVKGPGPGASGAFSSTNGSPRQSFGLFPLIPFLPTDTAKPWVAVGSTASSMSTYQPDVYVDIGGSGSGWTAARLATVRPAIQDSVNAGDSLQNRRAFNLLPVWPFLVVETGAAGLRGRLNHVYYGSEGYTQVGDSIEGVYTSGQRLMIDGSAHTARRAHLYPANAASVSPFGTAGVGGVSSDPADGGPMIFVKE